MVALVSSACDAGHGYLVFMDDCPSAAVAQRCHVNVKVSHSR